MRLLDRPEERFDRFLTFFFIIGLALYFWGNTCNMLVLLANNDSMPVIDGTELLSDDGARHHLSSHDEARLPLLADRITIRFPELPAAISLNPIFTPIDWWVRWIDYPAEGGLNIVSIGDIFRWVGSFLFLSLIPLILWRLMILLFVAKRTR